MGERATVAGDAVACVGVLLVVRSPIAAEEIMVHLSLPSLVLAGKEWRHS
jgi:hypothetical protein